MLTGLFWFATIFGVGVTVIDLLGLIGGGSGEDGSDGGDQGDNGGEDGSQGEVGGAPVLSFLRWARTLVYFCLGFGPFGLAAGAFGSGFGGRLAWSLAGGAATAVLARLFFRFQRTRLDSSLQDEELLMEAGNRHRGDRGWRDGQGAGTFWSERGGTLRARRAGRSGVCGGDRVSSRRSPTSALRAREDSFRGRLSGGGVVRCRSLLFHLGCCAR